MNVRIRLATVLLAIAAVACSSNSTGPAKPPSRAALNGQWVCVQVSAFYYNLSTNTERWRSTPQGRHCDNWDSVANWQDTALDKDFIIKPTNALSRVDHPDGQVAYDSATGVMTVSYPDRVDTYQLTNSEFVLQAPAADYTGDGRTDSVVVFFVHP